MARAIIVLLAALAALPAPGETILISVLETVDGSPSTPPLLAREGILQAFFERGDIAFDIPASVPVPSPSELVRLAREGGATLALNIEVTFTPTTHPQGGASFTVVAVYGLVQVESGATLREGKVQESGADRKALGLAIGKAIVGEIAPLLPGFSNTL